MPLIDNKVQWCLKKAEKEGERHRGLKKINKDFIDKTRNVLKELEH